MVLLDYGYQWGNLFLVAFVFLVIGALTGILILWFVKQFRKLRQESQVLEAAESVLKSYDILCSAILTELKEIKSKIK